MAGVGRRGLPVIKDNIIFTWNGDVGNNYE